MTTDATAREAVEAADLLRTTHAYRARNGYFTRQYDDDAVAAVLNRLEQLQQERNNEDTKPRKAIEIGTGMPAACHLEAFGQTIRDALGAMPYQVGSSITGKTWRDIDVRLMLDDDRFDALFPGYADHRQRDAWWNLVNAAISELGRVRTGLPVDFQMQRTSDANAKFPGPRNPLCVRRAGEDRPPAMLPPAELAAPDEASSPSHLLAATELVAGAGMVTREERGGTDHAAEVPMRTPEQWCAHYDVEIQDPDGWRHVDAPRWDEPTTLADFWKRAAVSTLRNVGSDGWKRIRQDAAKASARKERGVQ